MPSIQKTVEFYASKSEQLIYIYGSDDHFLSSRTHYHENIIFYCLGKKIFPQLDPSKAFLKPGHIVFYHLENLIWSFRATFALFPLARTFRLPFKFFTTLRAIASSSNNDRGLGISDSFVYAQFGPSFLPALAASILFGIRRIGRLYGCFFLDSTAKYGSLAVPLYWSEILLILSKPFRMVITDDGSGGDQFALKFGYSRKRLFFQPNGVDLRPESKSWITTQRINISANLNPTCIQLLSCCRLEEWKGVHSLVEGISRFIEITENIKPFHYTIVGSGDYESRIRRRISELSLDKYISMVPMVEQKDLFSYYMNAHVYCSFYFPTNVGNPLFESRLFGLPTLTVESGSTSHYVRHMVDSYVCASHSPLDISQGLGHFIMNPDLLLEYQIRAIDYSWSSVPCWPERLADEYRFLFS